jgi:hypothetical protein
MLMSKVCMILNLKWVEHDYNSSVLMRRVKLNNRSDVGVDLISNSFLIE